MEDCLMQNKQEEGRLMRQTGDGMSFELRAFQLNGA